LHFKALDNDGEGGLKTKKTTRARNRGTNAATTRAVKHGFFVGCGRRPRKKEPVRVHWMRPAQERLEVHMRADEYAAEVDVTEKNL